MKSYINIDFDFLDYGDTFLNNANQLCIKQSDYHYINLETKEIIITDNISEIKEKTIYRVKE